jgi:hypothetical protein
LAQLKGKSKAGKKRNENDNQRGNCRIQLKNYQSGRKTKTSFIKKSSKSRHFNNCDGVIKNVLFEIAPRSQENIFISRFNDGHNAKKFLVYPPLKSLFIIQ